GGKRLGHGTGWWWHTPDDRLDKMDQEILVRDTAIYFFTVWRLLADPVLPLDYAEHANYLLEELRALQNVAGKRWDLSVLISRAERLAAACARMRADDARLKALSRALVPLDYTEGDRLDHDPATPQGIYPGLQAIRRLAALEPGSDAARFLEVTVRRACSRVAAGLTQA